MQELQRNSAKAEILLKERHDIEKDYNGSGGKHSYPFDKTLWLDIIFLDLN